MPYHIFADAAAPDPATPANGPKQAPFDDASRRRTVAQNLATIAISAAVLFAFNVLRLCFSDVLFDCGLPWDLAHNLVAGFSYFAVWVAITHYRERWM